MTSATNPYALTALRVVTGFLFFQHGYPKLFGSLPGSGEAESAAELLSVIWVSGFLEVVGGLLILAGLLTRPVAFILAGEMASPTSGVTRRGDSGPAAMAENWPRFTASCSSICAPPAEARGAWTDGSAARAADRAWGSARLHRWHRGRVSGLEHPS